MKSLGMYYWYVKVPQCGCVKHRLEYIMFYVQKHIAPLATLFWSPAGSQRATRGAYIFETRWLKGCWSELQYSRMICLNRVDDMW